MLNREVSGLHEAAYLLGFFALLSQILALVRDRIFAHSFGAGQILDVYYASFRLPDIIFVSVASLVSLSVLIPFLTEKMQKKDAKNNSNDRAKQFLNSVFSAFFLSMVVVSIMAFFLAPYILSRIFSGLPQNLIESELIPLTRLLLIQPMFIGLSGLFASVTQIYRKFYLYALSPILYNIGIIFGVLILYPTFGIPGLGYGVIIGAFLHMCIQVPFIYSSGFLPHFTFNINWKEVKSVIGLSLPRTLALSAQQFTLLVLLGIASTLDEGSISIFNLSFNLQSVPLSIIGVSYSVAAFPTLSHLFAKGHKKLYLSQVNTAIRHILFWSLPALVLFIILRAQLVRVILGSGSFDWNDTRLTAASLAMFAFSIVAQSLVLLLVRSYYAAGRTMRPLIINISASVFIIICAYLLLYIFNMSLTFKYFIETLFKIEGVEGGSVLMLPFAYSIGLLLNAGALWVMFQHDFSAVAKSALKTLFESFSASVIMGFGAYLALQLLDKLFNTSTLFGIFMQGVISAILGVLAGIATLRLLRNKEIKEIHTAIRNRIWRAKVIMPEADGTQN